VATPALPITGLIEAALGADLDGDERTWTYTALTRSGKTRLLDRTSAVITRGQADERNGIEPATFSALLDNRDGELTPGRATSTLYPFFDLGCQIRYSLTNVGVPHLLTTGAATSRAGTVDHADFPTGDWFVGVEVEAPFYFPPTGSAYEIAGKFNVTGGQRSLLLYMLDDGTLRIRSSPDGTAEVNNASTIPLPRPIAGTFAFATWYDVANGGNRVMTVYAARTLDAILADPAGTVHETVTTAGTTSVFNSTATFDVGDVTGSGFAPFPGHYRRVEVRAGDSTGTVVTNPDFTIQTPGATSFADTAPNPKTWTVGALGLIERKQVRFVGQITSITPEWPDGDGAETAAVKIEASGELERFQRDETPLRSAIYRTVTAPRYAANIHDYFPLEDGRDATSAFAAIGGGPGGVAMNLASDDSLVSSGPLPSIGGGQPYGWNLTLSGTAPTSGWSAHWFLNLATVPAGGEFLDQRLDTTGGTTTQWIVRMDSGGYTLYAKDEAETNVLVDPIALGSDVYGDWLMVTLTVAQDGADIDYGVTFTHLGGGGGGAGGTLAGYTLGSPVRARSLDDQAPSDGFSWGHLVISSGLTTSFLVPADTGYLGETAAARIARLCDEAGIPYVVEGDDSAPVGPQRPVKLTQLLTDAAEADGGVLVELPNTRGIGYRTRASLLNQTPVFAVAADLNLGLDLKPVRDNQRTVNDFTASRTDGSSFHATDPDHIAKMRRYPDGTEVNVAYDWQLPYVAGRHLAAGTVAELRYPRVPVNLVADSAMHDAWLGAGPGDIFEITGLAAGTHPAATVPLILEGSTETISSTGWDLGLDNSPGSLWDAGVVDEDRADTAGSELAVAIDDNDTSLSVATTVWPPWRSVAGGASLPFGIAAGGEEMSVTDLDDIVATFGAVGTASHAVNASVTPGAPASVAAGNLLILFAAIRNTGAGTVNTPSGWERWPVFTETDNVAVFARIAQSGGEAMPTVTFSGGIANADTTAQVARFAGTYHDVTNLPVRWGRYISLSAQDIAYPATKVPYDDSVAMYFGWKQDDWTSVASPGTEIGEPDTTTGDDQGLVWGYTIQTTATDIAAGSFVVTGGAAAVTVGGVLVFHPDVQTFTVTRSANGVTKSHAAGTAVALADPMTAA